MTEARQHNTEIRLAVSKVVDKMDHLAAKVWLLRTFLLSRCAESIWLCLNACIKWYSKWIKFQCYHTLKWQQFSCCEKTKLRLGERYCSTVFHSMWCIVWRDSLPSGRCHTWFSAYSLQLSRGKSEMPLCTCLTLTCTHKFISNGLRVVYPCRWKSWRSKALLTAPSCLASPLSLWKPPWLWATSSASSRWAWPVWFHFIRSWGSQWGLSWGQDEDETQNDFHPFFPPPESSTQHFGVWVFSESELWVFHRYWQKVHVGEVQLLKPLWI